jgi:hypothetical protein
MDILVLPTPKNNNIPQDQLALYEQDESFRPCVAIHPKTKQIICTCCYAPLMLAPPIALHPICGCLIHRSCHDLECLECKKLRNKWDILGWLFSGIGRTTFIMVAINLYLSFYLLPLAVVMPKKMFVPFRNAVFLITTLLIYDYDVHIEITVCLFLMGVVPKPYKYEKLIFFHGLFVNWLFEKYRGASGIFTYCAMLWRLAGAPGLYNAPPSPDVFTALFIMKSLSSIFNHYIVTFSGYEKFTFPILFHASFCDWSSPEEIHFTLRQIQIAGFFGFLVLQLFLYKWLNPSYAMYGF